MGFCINANTQRNVIKQQFSVHAAVIATVENTAEEYVAVNAKQNS
jgi:hypothetical protein